MLANLIFFILALFVIALGPEVKANGWLSATENFFVGCLLYGATLSLILVQQKLLKKHKKLALILAESELVLFLVLSHFVLVYQRLIPSPFLQALFSICLYLIGLAVAHAKKEHALMLLPFALPFLFLTAIQELIPSPQDLMENELLQNYQGIIAISVTLLFIVSILIFFPPVIKRIWRCKPIDDPSLVEKLQSLAKKARFKHGGLYTWTVMNHLLTAGIIGVLPRFRYVMFSKRVLKELPSDQIEAIFAHEMGHSHYKHLLIFPFIFIGMMVVMAFFSYFFADSIDTFIASHLLEQPDSYWILVQPFAIFIPYGLIVIFYIRYVFGYFSRLFERQADLYTLTIGLSPEALINSLDHIGIHTGYTHKDPSWHHFSIQERINALKEAGENPNLITKHNLWVYLNVFIYFILLASTILFLAQQ